MGKGSLVRTVRVTRALASLALLVLVAGGCTGGDEGEPEPTLAAETETETETEAEPAQAEPSPEESSAEPSPSPSPSPSPTPTLDARFYVDSDGNSIPDFVETQLGYDPAVDDCALATNCPGIGELGGAPLDTDQNVLLMLDSSGSMAGADPSGAVKIDAAKAALERYVVGTPDNFNLGMLVFGHRGNNDESGRAESCAGIDVLNELGTLNVETVPGTLAQFQPTGWTPIAASLDRAAQAFGGREGQANRIVLVTDGIETCDGDPVAAATRLKQAGIAVTVDVVGFDVQGSSDQAALRAVAEATGGTYVNAGDAGALNAYFDDLLAQQGDLISALTCVLGSVSTARACAITISSEGRRELLREAEVLDRERSALVRELNDRVETWEKDYVDVVETEVQPVIDDLRRQLEEARARYRERYGEDIALELPPCPIV